MLAHSPDLAQAVLAGSKILDAAYDEARKAEPVVDAQVAANVQRKVARSKKAAKGEKISAITPQSACDPEGHPESDGTEEIELGKVIAKLRRDQPHNRDTMRVCDALERRVKRQ